MTIPTLIEKQDGFEIVRDQIAGILVAEVTNQMALAVLAGKDPDLWKLRIFTERSNAWEQFLNEVTDSSPLVNIWYDNSTFDPTSSNAVERQKAEGIFNIDCYGYAQTTSDGGSGQLPGDREAAYVMQRALRLVRNILMAAENTYLGLQGLVWRRWPDTISVFQPRFDNATVQNISAARIAFNVWFNETSPQVAETTLATVALEITRAEDGQIVLEADYEYPLS